MLFEVRLSSTFPPGNALVKLSAALQVRLPVCRFVKPHTTKYLQLEENPAVQLIEVGSRVTKFYLCAQFPPCFRHAVIAHCPWCDQIAHYRCRRSAVRAASASESATTSRVLSFLSSTLILSTLSLTTTNGKTTWTSIRHLHSFPDFIYWLHVSDMDNMALVWS